MPSSHIFPSGGLLTHQFVEAIQQPTFAHPALAPETFALPGGKTPSPAELERAIGSAWELLVERWDGVERDLPGMDISTLRDRWVRPLLSLLDFNLEYNRADLVVEDDLRFPISHFAFPLGTASRVPFHSVLPVGADSAASMDARRDGGTTLRRLGPHDLMQRYLNLTRDSLWAMVTDGLRLRLLRDYHHSYTRGYVEFDLAGIFAERDFAAFRALYRLCHASRFLPMAAAETPAAKGKAQNPQPGRRKKSEELAEEEMEGDEDITVEEEATPVNITPLESFYQHALSTGVKVGEDLRGSVRAAIEGFGNGFLDATPGLTSRIQSGEIPVANYYDDILHVIYRILFLLFAEQRGMFPGRGSLYMEEYSLTALRTLAEHAGGEDQHTDLWERLKVTFRMVEQGADTLGIYGYNGMLFSPEKTPILAGGGEDDPRLRNDALLKVIKKLTTVERDGALQRISYADLSVEEIGSVYESLLDYNPRISTLAETVEGREIAPGMFYLDPRGKARKTSGSYYTHPALVNELIKSALLPVLAARLKAAVPTFDADHPELLTPEQRSSAEAALLAMKVIDPAAGSGAFLIAADNTLALRLAQIRTGDLFPAEREIRKARRDVLANCLYAVDLNPMAVELCKLSLWINAVVEDQKLNFLDHHIRAGNSLVGAFRRLVAQGIPSEAYGGATSDDKDLAKALKKRNEAEKAGQLSAFRVMEAGAVSPAEWTEVSRLAQSDPHAAEARYRELQARSGESGERLAFDLWTAAFFWPLEAEGDGLSMADRARAGITQRRGERQTPLPPTHQDIAQALAAPRLVDGRVKAFARDLRDSVHFFHWELEFPEVFGNDENGGFDVILCNPPWEKIKLQEKEFFQGSSQEILSALNSAARKKMISALPQSHPWLWELYKRALLKSECTAKFLKFSTRFPLTAVGDINTFSIFAELISTLVSSKGRTGIIVPTGLATDYTNRTFFGFLVKSQRITSLLDFQNSLGLFPGVDRNQKFILLTTCGNNTTELASFAFGLRRPDEAIENKFIHLSAADLELMNVNTLNCPIFREKNEVVIAQKIYRSMPVLIRHGDKTYNEWETKFGTMFHMANDSHLFIQNEQVTLDSAGARFVQTPKGKEKVFPLYEGKMIYQFDHRYAHTAPPRIIAGIRGSSDYLTEQDHSDAETLLQSRYYVKDEEVKKKFSDKWFLGYREVTGTVANMRTGFFSLIPEAAIGHKILLVFISKTPKAINSSLFIANANSFVLDFCSRQKISGLSFSNYILEQLPFISPSRYGIKVLPRLISISFELLYNAWDLINYANELWNEANETMRRAILSQWDENVKITGGGHKKAQRPNWADPETPNDFPRPPFKWDDERRAYLRAELDGLYAHLYGLTRDEFSYILDTFPIVRRKDEAKFGEFRTKRLCLETYDRLVDSDLIPAEARALQQSSVLQQHDVLKESARPVTPAAADAPISHAPRKTTGRLEAAAEKLPAADKSQPAAEKPQQAAEEKPPVEKQPDAPRQSAPAAPVRAESAAGRSQPAAGKRSPAEKTQPGAEEQPMLTDFGLYKCLDCGRMVLGYDRVNHARKDHHGVEPEWKKMGK